MTTRHYIVLSGMVVALHVLAMDVAATEVKLRARVVTGSSVVRLGDVAEIKADDAAEQRRLAGLLLMPAPAPGTQRFLRQREVQDVLAAHGEDLGRVQCLGASQILVVSQDFTHDRGSNDAQHGTERSGIDRQAVLAAGKMKREQVTSKDEKVFDELDVERVRSDVDALLTAYLTSKAGHADAWRVTSNLSDRFLSMVHSATSTPTCAGGMEPWTGRQRFVVSFSTPKGTMQLPVYADVALATRVVVASQPIERGAVITAAHLEEQLIDYMPSAKERRMPTESMETLIGMEARESIRTGEMIFAEEVRAPLMVRRGEEITVTAQGGGIRVRTTARATQDGSMGDLVQVETLDKKDRYDARVIGARKVAVFTGARPMKGRSGFERVVTAWK